MDINNMNVVNILTNPATRDMYLELRMLQNEVNSLEDELKEHKSEYQGKVLNDLEEGIAPEEVIGTQNKAYLTERLNLLRNSSKLPDNPCLSDQTHLENIYRDVEADIKKMNEIRTRMELRLKDEESIKKRLDKRVEDGTKCLGFLTKKYEACVVEAAENSGTNLVAKVRTQKARVKRQYEELMTEFADFLEKYFPPPTDADIRQNKKKFPLTRFNATAANTHALSKMIEDLVQASDSNQNGGYIEIDENTWPSYTEMLYRVGLIQFHPDDNELYRLSDLTA